MAIHKKLVLFTASFLLLAAAVIIVIVTRSQTEMTDDQIKKKFNCDRVTADSRPTDVYCTDPALYREHLTKGAVIKYP